jgi:hemolysin III
MISDVARRLTPMRAQFHAHQRPYELRELWADGVVQVVAASAGLIAGLGLLLRMAGGAGWSGVAVYVASLIAMLGFSAIYNIWPVSPLKWLLRRFDHAAIYFLIAGTYTPLLPFLQSRTEALLLGGIVWSGALAGMALKFLAPGRYDRLAIALYLLLGWVGVMAAPSFLKVLPVSAIAFIVAGGLIYSAGVVFHLWDGLRYQNAIWHGFVAVAAACHFTAIALLYG